MRNKIYYDLSKSPYFVKNSTATFYFSSNLHLEKFISRCATNRSSINNSLKKRFGFNIEMNAIADIILYKKIENRGFRIKTHDGGLANCLDNIILSGDNRTSIN